MHVLLQYWPARGVLASQAQWTFRAPRQHGTRTRVFGTTGASMEAAIAYLATSGAASQAVGCLALAKLLRHNVLPGVARSTAVKQGAIERLVSALKTHPMDTAVQNNGGLLG